MLYLAEMTVRIPPDMRQPALADLTSREREIAQRLQREGRWRHLWRVAGRYANVSVFEVSSPEELHDLISALPLFPYMDVQVTALARHPSAID